MEYKEKIAVFDLDGTLYVANSHIEILCQYYNTVFFKSIWFKAFGKIFPGILRRIMWRLYDKITVKEKEKFILPFRKSVVAQLNERIKNGYYPLIISNAPKELVINAARYLKVSFLVAKANEKAKILKENYNYSTLFVCTDNITDLDLINIADEALIACKVGKREFFRKNIAHNSYCFIED